MLCRSASTGTRKKFPLFLQLKKLNELQQAWEAELAESQAGFDRLFRQARKANSKGDIAKVRELEKQMAEYITLCDSCFLPELPKKIRTKGIPRKIRSSDSGISAWQTLKEWDALTREDRSKVLDALFEMPGWEKWHPVVTMIRRLHSRDADYFSKLGIALAETESGASDLSLRTVKQNLLVYRWSLTRSKTPGRPRHTPEEIKEIVAPQKAITKAVFRNMLHELRIPHLPAARGRRSRHYIPNRRRNCAI
jgi:hypothetical protein